MARCSEDGLVVDDKNAWLEIRIDVTVRFGGIVTNDRRILKSLGEQR